MQEISRQLRIACLVLFLTFLTMLVWGVTAKIKGAVISQGNIVFLTSLKNVQHKEGGIVAQVLVKEGEEVTKDQVVIRLNSKVSKASLESISDQIKEQAARSLRLKLERDNEHEFPQVDTSGANEALFLEKRLFIQRKRTKQQKIKSIKNQMAMLSEKLDKNQTYNTILRRQKKLQQEHISAFDNLYKHGLITIAERNSAERDLTETESILAQLAISDIESKAEIERYRIQILDIESNSMAEILSELKDNRTLLTRLLEQEVAAQDELERSEILAPVSGKIQGLKIHTAGGVISPGELLMSIAPKTEELIVEARVDPKSVDQIHPGRSARMHFTSFASSVTPTIHGEVKSISSDLLVGKNNEQYYLARLEIPSDSLNKEIGRKITAGMPVEVHITTTERAAISYFLKPIADQFNRAFNDD